MGDTLQQSLLAGVKAAAPELKDVVKKDIILKPLKWFDEATGTSRRLAVKKLAVEYEFLVPAGMGTSADALAKAIGDNKAAFEDAMEKKYVEAYTAATGSAPKGFSVEASATAGTKTITVAPPTPAPTPSPPAPTPAPTPSPPSPPATTAAPAPPSPTGAPAPSVTEEEDDSGSGAVIGGVIGALVGVALLGGLFYMWKKKNSQE